MRATETTGDPGPFMGPLALVLSCEHGGHAVPTEWQPRFDGAAAVLESHEGWDPGALELARGLARRLAERGQGREAPLVAITTTRLLVEANRSLHHPRLFSRFTRDLSPEERRRLVREHWRPHRLRVEAAVGRRLGEGRPVLHLGVHTFTPVLDGRVRDVDVGLLYDPARRGERDLCSAWAGALRSALPDLRIRRNAPYRGVADGLTTFLRRTFGADRYLGVELEVGQGLLASDGRFPSDLVAALARTLVPLLGDGNGG